MALQHIEVIVVILFPAVILARFRGTERNQFAVPHLPEHRIGGHVKIAAHGIFAAGEAFQRARTVHDEEFIRTVFLECFEPGGINEIIQCADVVDFAETRVFRDPFLLQLRQFCGIIIDGGTGQGFRIVQPALQSGNDGLPVDSVPAVQNQTAGIPGSDGPGKGVQPGFGTMSDLRQCFRSNPDQIFSIAAVFINRHNSLPF